MCDPTGGANSSLAALSLYPSLPNCCGRAAAAVSSPHLGDDDGSVEESENKKEAQVRNVSLS